MRSSSLALGTVRLNGDRDAVHVLGIAAPSQNLVMVTPTGDFTSGDDSAKRTFFESLGWTVSAIDDSAGAAAFTAAASANDVMFVSDTINDVAHEAKVRDADIGVVAEKFGSKGIYLFGTPNEDFTNQTTMTVVDNTHFITEPFATGSLTIYSAADDVNYWLGTITALPSGVQVLADSPTNTEHQALYVAETGATLYSANVAPNRRVFIPSDAALYSVWTADYQTIIERSLLWAAGADTCADDSDGDGLGDCWEAQFGDTDGDTTPNELDADDDGDGIPTASENADPNSDGDPRDALDSDRDGQPDYLDLPASPASLALSNQQKVSEIQGGLGAVLDPGDRFGRGLAAIGDLDGDGVVDLLAGVETDDDGGTDRGAAYVLFMNGDGTVRAQQKISSTAGGFGSGLDNGDLFGVNVGSLGDVDGDGVPDVAVGAIWDDDGGADRGAVYVLFLNRDGTVKRKQKISDTQGGLNENLADADRFGLGVSGLGDVDGDGIPDMAVGLFTDDDGAVDAGAVLVLFLDVDGTVRSEQKISDTQGLLSSNLTAGDEFGFSVGGPGDIVCDGTADLVVGAVWDDDGGSDRGAVYVLFLNGDGTVKSEQKISDTQGGLTGTLDDSDWFGYGVAGLGDVDGDSVPDIAVGAGRDDDGGTDRGAIYLLLLNSSGTVKAEQKLSSTAGGFTGPLDDGDEFGAAMSGLGDLDEDGTIGIAVSAVADDDGGLDQGSFYILDLTSAPMGTATVNSTGDAADATPGDGLCDTGGVNNEAQTSAPSVRPSPRPTLRARSTPSISRFPPPMPATPPACGRSRQPPSCPTCTRP
ncbi:MAG: FG-GAP-like repeat-containing protein [Acidimicrobiales bacterium]